MRTMFIFFSLFTIMGAAVVGQNYISDAEGITYDSLYNRYIISTYTGNIIGVDIETGHQSILASGLGVCNRTFISNDTLWVALNNRVGAFDLETGEEFFSVSIDEADIGIYEVLADGSGFLYILFCDYGPGAILKMDMSTLEYSTFADFTTYHPLGMHLDRENNQLLVPTFFSSNILSVSLEDSSISVYAAIDTVGHNELLTDPYGNFYLSTVSTNPDLHYNIYQYNHDFTESPEWIAGGFRGSLNFCINPHKKEIVAVAFFDDFLTYIPMSNRTSLSNYTVDDSEYGDGDNVPQAGELFNLTVELYNDGWDEIENLTLDISCDDASISIVDGNSFIGQLDPYQTVSNQSDPFLIELPTEYSPPRINTITIIATYDTDQGPGDIELEINIGMGDLGILIIDDDEGDTLECYYQQALGQLNIPCETTTSSPELTVDDLNDYEVVIWFTGDYRSDFINSNEINIISSFLDNGGNLFLTGQGIATQLNNDNPTFLQDDLKCQYQGMTYSPIIINDPSCQVMFPGDTLKIAGDEGAQNQNVTENILPYDGSVAELISFGSSFNAGVSYQGTYGLVYYTFGLESVSSSNGRYNSQSDVLRKVLDFFNYQIPNYAPTVSDLLIMPGDTQHMTDHYPTFTWSYSDEDLQEQQFYQIQVNDDNSWNFIETWDSGPVSSSVSEAVYSGIELIDGQRYYVRVRSCDNSIWSNWINGEMRMNSVPIPDQLNPSNLDTIAQIQPLLTHDIATDAEGDDLTYFYELYSDDGLTDLVEFFSQPPPEFEIEMSWQITSELTVDENYFWRVRCDDPFESGEWSIAAGFIVKQPYLCGDSNGDENPDIGDAVFVINNVFKGGPLPDPIEACDGNCDSQCNVGDAVFMINHVFKGGPPPCESCK